MIYDTRCKKCGRDTVSLILEAMMSDAGVKVYPSPLECADGGKHEFETVKEHEPELYRGR